MRVATCFSGIGCPELAWQNLGWNFVWKSEIHPFASAVLRHHYSSFPNLGDIKNVHQYAKKIQAKFGPVDLICGGSPCQSFSVAGLRRGLDDPRGNLMLTYLGVVSKFKPKWVVWENVPGVLSVDGGRAFATFITSLEELGYEIAYRILDAQHFGVPQRRRRVFVVGYFGDWRRAAAVLFDRQSMSGNIKPGTETGPASSPAAASGTGSDSSDFRRNIMAWNAKQSSTAGAIPGPVAPTLLTTTTNGIILFGDIWNGKVGNVSQTLQSHTTSYSTHSIPAVIRQKVFGPSRHPLSVQPTLSAFQQHYDLDTEAFVVNESEITIRRITPLEAERRQGFPDGYTYVPYNRKMATDSPRYFVIGNSMARPVLEWIGNRIKFVDAI